MIELEQERRKKELEFWNDTMELRRGLKEFLRRYLIGLERVKVWRDRVGNITDISTVFTRYNQ